MNEHQKETEFLRHCISYDESPARQKLDRKLTRIQQDEHSVRRAVWLMAVLTVLAVFGLGYAVVLMDNFPQDWSQLTTRIISTLGLATLICLVAFVGLRMIYRLKLNGRREECRQMVMRLLESRLGKPVIRPLPDSRVGHGIVQAALAAAKVNVSPDKTESTARI